MPAGVVGDVDTVSWAVPEFELKSAGGFTPAGLKGEGLAPAGRPLMVRVAPTGQATVAWLMV